MDKLNARENKSRIYFGYKIGEKVLLIVDSEQRKAGDRNIGPYVVTEMFSNGTVRIQCGTISERINIRRLVPFN